MTLPSQQLLAIQFKSTDLNLLGKRQPDIYGTQTLSDIHKNLTTLARTLGHTLTCKQSNAEYELINFLHECHHQQSVDFILFNPAAFTHTSIALRDAVLATAFPFIEVHISRIHRREPFRRHSYFSDIAVGTVSGFGTHSYELALQAAHRILSQAHPGEPTDAPQKRD